MIYWTNTIRGKVYVLSLYENCEATKHCPANTYNISVKETQETSPKHEVEKSMEVTIVLEDGSRVTRKARRFVKGEEGTTAWVSLNGKSTKVVRPLRRRLWQVV